MRMIPSDNSFGSVSENVNRFIKYPGCEGCLTSPFA
jgi:hypothetical protein